MLVLLGKMEVRHYEKAIRTTSPQSILVNCNAETWLHAAKRWDHEHWQPFQTLCFFLPITYTHCSGVPRWTELLVRTTLYSNGDGISKTRKISTIPRLSQGGNTTYFLHNSRSAHTTFMSLQNGGKCSYRDLYHMINLSVLMIPTAAAPDAQS